MVSIVFINDCAADGCYKKNLGGGKQLCAKHQKMYDDGVSFKAFYGKVLLKKEFQQKQHDVADQEVRDEE